MRFLSAALLLGFVAMTFGTRRNALFAISFSRCCSIGCPGDEDSEKGYGEVPRGCVDNPSMTLWYRQLCSLLEQTSDSTNFRDISYNKITIVRKDTFKGLVSLETL